MLIMVIVNYTYMKQCNMFKNKIGKPGVGEGSILGCTIALTFLIMSVMCLVQNFNLGGIVISLLGFGVSSLLWVFGLGMIRDE